MYESRKGGIFGHMFIATIEKYVGLKNTPLNLATGHNTQTFKGQCLAWTSHCVVLEFAYCH